MRPPQQAHFLVYFINAMRDEEEQITFVTQTEEEAVDKLNECLNELLYNVHAPQILNLDKAKPILFLIRTEPVVKEIISQARRAVLYSSL